MRQNNEYEIVRHTAMDSVELFLVELVSRNPHGHSDLEIGMLLKGSLELILENRRLLLKENDIYVINRYQIHAFQHTRERNLVLAFQISSRFYGALNSQLKRMQFPTLVGGEAPLHPPLARALKDCAAAYFGQAPYFELTCAALLLEALHTLTGSGEVHILSEKEQDAVRNSSLRLNRITDYIAEHYTERISLVDLAALEHITPQHLSHFIRQRMGVSFQDYLNNLRFEHAYQLLTQTSLNILEICMESGFSSSRYLNQMCERHLGCTASEFRRRGEKAPLPPPVLPTDNLQKRLSLADARRTLEL